MLGHRLRRCPNINPTLYQRVSSCGIMKVTGSYRVTFTYVNRRERVCYNRGIHISGIRHVVLWRGNELKTLWQSLCLLTLAAHAYSRRLSLNVTLHVKNPFEMIQEWLRLVRPAEPICLAVTRTVRQRLCAIYMCQVMAREHITLAQQWL